MIRKYMDHRAKLIHTGMEPLRIEQIFTKYLLWEWIFVLYAFRRN